MTSSKHTIYHLPVRQNQNITTTANKGRQRSNKLKYIKALIALLLANEIIIGLVVTFSSEQPASNAIAIAEQPAALATSTSEQQTFSPPPPPKNTIAFSAPDINASQSFDIDDLRHACLSFTDESLHHISYRGVYGSWDGRTKDRYDRESFHLASRKNHWLRTSFVSNTQNLSMTNFASPVMFVPAILDHSHCIHDLLFSLLPMASQGKLRDFQAIAVKRPDVSDDLPVRSYAGDYCTLVLEGLGWFKSITTVPNNTCVDNLWVPAMMYHRSPRGSAKNVHSGNDYFHTQDLPLEIMQFFQRQMGKSFLANNKFLSKIYGEKKNKIIFDSREGMGKGEWTNAKEIAKLVQEQLDPELFAVEVVEDVGALTIEEQAALFGGAAILVAPHGGSIANIIFMRPSAVVFELSCGEASWVRDWATDLGIRHSIVRADELPCKVEGRRTYTVQPLSLVDLIIDLCWRGQRKKEKEKTLS